MPSLNAYQTSMGELIKNSSPAIVGEIYCVNISFHMSDRLFRQSERSPKGDLYYLITASEHLFIGYTEELIKSVRLYCFDYRNEIEIHSVIIRGIIIS